MHLTIFNKLGINKYVSQIERTDLYKRPSGGEPVKLLSSSFFFAECWLNMSQRAPNWQSVLTPEGGFGAPNVECQGTLRWNVGHWSEVHCQCEASHDPQMAATPTSIMLPTSKARRQRREMGSVYGRLEIHRPLVSEPLPDSEKPSKSIKSSWFILIFSTKRQVNVKRDTGVYSNAKEL